MKVGVTGHTGFLGKYVLDALKRHAIDFVLMDKTKQSLFNVESMKSFVEQCDAVIHLAGVNRDNPNQILTVNAKGTLGLLEAIKRFKKNIHLIFASTFQVYGEDTVYAVSKKAAEEFISIYGTQDGINSTILRISNIYGPGGKPFYNSVIATFVYNLINGRPIMIHGEGNQKRDYIYASDVADAFVKALSYERRNVTEYFDICTGKETSLREIIEVLKAVHSQNFTVQYSEDKQDKYCLNKNYDKAKRQLQWEPKISIEKGLKTFFK